MWVTDAKMVEPMPKTLLNAPHIHFVSTNGGNGSKYVANAQQDVLRPNLQEVSNWSVAKFYKESVVWKRRTSKVVRFDSETYHKNRIKCGNEDKNGRRDSPTKTKKRVARPEFEILCAWTVFSWAVEQLCVGENLMRPFGMMLPWDKHQTRMSRLPADQRVSINRNDKPHSVNQRTKENCWANQLKQMCQRWAKIRVDYLTL